MKDLLEFLLNKITGTKDFSINEDAEGERTMFTVKAKPSAIGFIIGKKGRTLRAIRNLLKIRATLEKKHVQLLVTDSDSD